MHAPTQRKTMRARWQGPRARGFTLVGVFGLLGLLGIASTEAAENTGAKIVVRRLEGSSLAVQIGKHTLWQFHYARNQAVPYFHPIALPGMPSITNLNPPDHPWHYGLWFSWKYINGVNYWEIDPKTGLPEGRTSFGDVEVQTHDNGAARIALRLAYAPQGSHDAVLTEKRVIEVSPPHADGSFFMDWVSTYSAGDNEVALNRTPLASEPNGFPYGGYAGLSLRFNDLLADPQAVSADGPYTFHEGRVREKSSGLDFSGLFAGRPLGVTMLDHPQNLNHPTPWYAIASEEMRYMNAAVLCFGPHTMQPRASFQQVYRIIVHPGRFDAAQIKRAYDAFAN